MIRMTDVKEEVEAVGKARDKTVEQGFEIKPMEFTDEQKRDILLQLFDKDFAISYDILIYGKLKVKFQTLTGKQVQEIEAAISEVMDQKRTYNYIANEMILYHLAHSIYSYRGEKLEGNLQQKKDILSNKSDIVLNELRDKYLSFAEGVRKLTKEEGVFENFSSPS